MKTDIKTQMAAVPAETTLAELEAKYPLAAARGSDAGVESETTTTCETCGGYGWHPNFDGHGTEIGTPQCETCDGTGRVEKAKPQPNASNSATGDRGASPAKADGKA